MVLYPGAESTGLFRLVDVLKASYLHVRLVLLGPDRFDECLGACDGRDARNVELERGLADGLFVIKRNLTERRVDNDGDLTLANEVGDVWPAFVYLEDRVALEPHFTKAVGCSECCNK